MNRAKEKSKSRNTKEKDLLDLDNEIIIGIKTLPKSEEKKHGKKSKKSIKENRQKDLRKKTNKNAKKNSNKTSKSSNAKMGQDEFELSLGIEDKLVKNNNNKKTKNNTKKKPKLTQKQQEMLKRKRKRIFRIIKWTTLVLLLIGGGIYFLLSPFFNVKEIIVSGNEKITSEELVSLSEIQLEENTFKISNKKVEQSIKSNAYIDTIKLHRKLPDKIEIKVTERKPAYMITLGNAYVYVDIQGYLLEVSKTALEIPIITGFLTAEDQIQVGNRLCTEDLKRLNSVIQIMDSAKNIEIVNLINKINIADEKDYVLELSSQKKTVHLGDTSNLSTKMLYVKTVMEKEKDKEGDIFVNTDLSNKGAIFREKV